MIKLAILCILALCLSCFKLNLQEYQLFRRNSRNGLKSDVISPGRGYSTDRQQMSSVVCFNTKVSPYGKTESIVRLDQGTSFKELQNTLKIDVSTKVGIGIFSIEAGVEYMKYVKDTDFSMSINYYQFVQSEVNMEMGYGPAGALTQDGLRAYGPVDKPNPRFGLICGDQFVSSYKVGAQLLLSIKLQFNSHTEKESFSAKFGVNFGSFLSISTDIQKTISQTNSSGSMTILGYQSGGNPAELAKILNSSCGSNYCAGTCSLQKLTDCNAAVNGLLKYAINNFPAQVNIQDVRTLSAFPIGFAKLQNIKWIGLDVPPSYVTQNVLEMRQQLSDAIMQNIYYSDHLNALLKANLPWVKTSNVYKLINELINKTQYNLNLFMDQNQGGIVCYDDPQSCVDTGNHLQSRRKSLTYDIPNVIRVIKYKIKITPCEWIYYRVGDGPSTSDWYTDTKSTKCQMYNQNVFQLTQETHLLYNSTVMYQGSLHNYTSYNVVSRDANSAFTGTEVEDYPGKRNMYDVTVPRIVSEYSFDFYQ